MVDATDSDVVQLARLGFGCVKLGSLTNADGRSATRLIHAAVDTGVTFFDTADAYGAGISERILGQSIGRRREGVRIATKGGYTFRERGEIERSARRALGPVLGMVRRRIRPNGDETVAPNNSYATQDFSPAYLRGSVDRSLRRLRTDYIDIFQFHGPAAVCSDETLHVMDDLIAAGKIRKFGVGLERLDRATDWFGRKPVSAAQVPFGVLDAGARSEIFPAAKKSGIELIVRGIFGSGLFGAVPSAAGDKPNDAKLRFVQQLRSSAETLNVDVHQLAVWWVLAHAEVDVALIGINSVEHLVAAAGYVRKRCPDRSIVEDIDRAIGLRGAADLP
jgi:aryl-alcohol dehydrogenase-like predicted oxidoreductase